MPVTRPLAASPAASRPEHARDPKPFGGWAMAKAAGLDRSSARGLVADLLTATTLRRQAAFVVLATVPLDGPRPFLARLDEPNASLGDVICELPVQLRPHGSEVRAVGIIPSDV